MDRKCIQRDLCILETQHNTWLPHQLESISSSSMRCFDLTGNRSTARVTDQLTLHRNCSSGEREGERRREDGAVFTALCLFNPMTKWMSPCFATHSLAPSFVPLFLSFLETILQVDITATIKLIQQTRR